MARVFIFLLVPAFLLSRVASFPVPTTSIATDSPPTLSETLLSPEIDSIDGINGRRIVLGALFVVATNGALLPVSSSLARAVETPMKSNFNYELANDECQTDCVRNCQLESPGRSRTKLLHNDNSGDCIEACVRSGKRYCHPSAKASPTLVDAATSQYVATTKEPTIQSSKPIPGLLYNPNRGGVWRDKDTAGEDVVTTREPTIKSSKPIPGISYNSNRGGAWRD